MKLAETLKVAIKALLSNKARSFLTMLGVIIGVFSVVTLVSLGKGIQNYITDEFDALGSNLLFISPGKLDVADDPGKQFSRNKLAEKHVDLIKTHASDHLGPITGYVLVGETTEYKTNRYFSEIIGVNEDGVTMFNYVKAKGRYFNKTDVKNEENVAIIGPIIQEELFATQDPIGKKIKIGNDRYEVIGTFEEKGSNYDDQIIIPVTSALNSFDIQYYSSIIAKSKTGEDVNILTREVQLALLRDLKSDEFTVLSQEDLLSSIQEILGVLTTGLGAIAGISLLVGGIGIMNIMLVSVTERIREIGLRKALGATSRTVGLQFMVEAILLSVIGGGIGLTLGGLVTFGIQSFVRAEVTLGAVLLAFGFSTLVGVVFGTYPAYNASKLDPIEALRYE